MIRGRRTCKTLFRAIKRAFLGLLEFEVRVEYKDGETATFRAHIGKAAAREGAE